MSNISYAKSGDILQYTAAVNTLVYTTLVFFFAAPGSQIFDEQWLGDGFCVFNKDVPYWSSHDLCFYWDVVLVAVGMGVWYRLRNSGPEMKFIDDLLKGNLFGHLGHGVAHGYIAYTLYRSSSDPDEAASRELSMEIGLLFGFWFGLLKGGIPQASNRTVAMLAVAASTGQMFVRENFNFGYVQAIISVAFISSRLLLPASQKNFSYLCSGIANLVISLVPWIECMACQSSAVKVLGGHLIFDVSIPITAIGSYVASWYYFNSGKETKLKKV